jgi:CheY-like chemotaxis protein
VTTSTQPTRERVEILIAEDSPTQAQRLQHILEQHGYYATHAANGRLALDAARSRKPTLIISDVVMPRPALATSRSSLSRRSRSQKT